MTDIKRERGLGYRRSQEVRRAPCAQGHNRVSFSALGRAWGGISGRMKGMSKTSFKILSVFAMMAAALTLPANAVAQEKPAKEATSDDSKSRKAAKKKNRKAPPKVVELEEMVIEGRIQKPEVFYILGRAEARYQDVKLDKGFVDRILKSVESNPF